jgi:ribosomal protein L7/L12
VQAPVSHCQVKVTSLGKQVQTIRSLRLLGNLGLLDAKTLEGHLRARLPCILAAGLSQERAQQVAALITDAGGAAVVEPSSVDQPMVLAPNAARTYQWNWLGINEVR